MYDDTIAAIATAVGPAGIGIIRISGAEAAQVLNRVFRPSAGQAGAVQSGNDIHFESHRMCHGYAIDPISNDRIDEVLALWMKAPGSYTREDVAEIHCHGGPMPAERVLSAVLTAGARLARPGEFTLRAFLNGRIDLAQAEAVADLIESRTDRARAMAMADLAGRLSHSVRPLRQRMMAVLAYLEATIDFVEDEIPPEDVRGALSGVLESVQGLLATADLGIVSRQGVKVAIVGRPNVGKSSLLNALLRTDRAIVTEIPGTTRDTVEEVVNLRGVPIWLVDTAGISEAENPIERLGVERSRRALEEADLCLLVVDRSEPLQEEDLRIAFVLQGRPVVAVANKEDLPPAISIDAVRALVENAPIVSTSTLKQTGLQQLEEAVLQTILGGDLPQGDQLLVSSPRHKDALSRVSAHLRDALASLEASLPADCTASDVKAAMDAVGEITGESASADLLDTIFARFCVGK